MAAFDYTKIRDKAASIIERFGGPLAVDSVENGSFDPATGALSSSTTQTISDGVVLDITNSNNPFSVVEAGDRKLLIDATPFSSEPKVNDLVTYYDGTLYVIREVLPLNPAGTDVIYTCRVGK